MSKAFTREDDAGLEAPPTGVARPHARAPRTAMGAKLLRAELERARSEGDAERIALLEGKLAAGLVPPPEDPRIASLGAEVTLRDARGRERVVRIVTPDEVGLVPSGASPTSPLAHAVVGAREGDTVELGPQELVVAKIDWPS